MSESLRRWLIPTGLLLVLAAVNFSIWQKETLIASGTPVSLPLAPVDPRSLMQGDYMALDWQLARELTKRYASLPDTGKVVLHFVGGTTRAELARLDDGQPLAKDEVRLDYRVRDGRVKVATDAYFFQEGTASAFEQARYGDLRVAPGGTAILVGLQDKDLATIKPAPMPEEGQEVVPDDAAETTR